MPESSNRYARKARERARKLRDGEILSDKETAKILSDAAQEIDALERQFGRVKKLEEQLALAEAWRRGLECGMNAKKEIADARAE